MNIVQNQKPTDTVLIHKCNQVCFSEIIGFGCFALSNLAQGRFKFLPLLEVRYSMASPFLIDVNIEVVTFSHNKPYFMRQSNAVALRKK